MKTGKLKTSTFKFLNKTAERNRYYYNVVDSGSRPIYPG